MGLKAVPNKNAGFIILLTSIFTFFVFGEIRNLTALCLLNNNSFSLSFFLLCSLSFLWIGAQFPQEKFFSFIFPSLFSFFSLDRCSIPSREVSILCSYLDIILLFSSYVYLII